MSFIASKSFSLYYLPELSDLENNNKNNIINRYLSISPFIIILLYVPFIIFNKYLIAIFFSHEFTQAYIFLRWLIISEVIKFYIFMFTYPIIARGKFKFFLSLEVFFNLSFLVLSFLSIGYFSNLEMLCISYLIVNIFYLISAFIYINYKFDYSINKNNFLTIIFVSFLILLTSYLNWYQDYNILNNILYIFILLITLYFSNKFYFKIKLHNE